MQNYLSMETARPKVEYLLASLSAKLTEAIRTIPYTPTICRNQDIVIPGLLGVIKVFKCDAIFRRMKLELSP